MRQLAFNIFASADKVLRVVVVLFNTGRHGEDIRVEDDVFRREAHLFSQNPVRPTTNLDFTLAGIGGPAHQRPSPPLPRRSDAEASHDE